MRTSAQLFLDEINAFLKRSGRTASAFGMDAVNDPNLVGDLRKGRMPSLRLVDRVKAFMVANKPTARRLRAKPAPQPEKASAA